MKALVTGSCGVVGFAACRRLLADGWLVVGVDNDQRAHFFGARASTATLANELASSGRYRHVVADVRDAQSLRAAFGSGVDLVIHAAGQPSGEWALTHVHEDFAINALGTLNVLETWRALAPKAPLVHVSTLKALGDPLAGARGAAPLVESATRFDVPENHALWNGIPEGFRADEGPRSFLAVSSRSADLLALEYGHQFDLPVGVFRPGCVTGGHHKATEQHGFLQYLMRCVRYGIPYRVFGHKQKQLRCCVHADDLVDAFLRFASDPRPGAAYHVGGRALACSLTEALAECQERSGREGVVEYLDAPRSGDPAWRIADARKLEEELGWTPKHSLDAIFDELFETAEPLAAPIRPITLPSARPAQRSTRVAHPEWTEISV